MKRRIAEAYQRKVDNVKARFDAFTIVPARFQGTVVESWARYWKFLVKDYFSVIFGVVKDAKNRPVRAMIIGGTGTILYKLSERNPTDEDFRSQLKNFGHELGSLPEKMQNPVSRDHLISLERLYSNGTLRRLDLGVASIFWRHDHNPELKTYLANCSFMQPDWRNFRERIVEVGFMDRFWMLEKKMKDYDVNTEDDE